LEREPKAIEVDLGTPVEYALNVKLRIVVAGARGLPLKEKVRNFSHNDNLRIIGGTPPNPSPLLCPKSSI